MDFMERLFGISIDGGDGSLERLYVVAFVVLASALLVMRRQLHQRR
jgi:hypothetical protein